MLKPNTMKFDRVCVEELDFPPGVHSDLGLETAHEVSDRVKTHTELRIGKIVAKGSECTDHIQVDDVVLYSNLHAIPFTTGDYSAHYIREDNLLGKY